MPLVPGAFDRGFCEGKSIPGIIARVPGKESPFPRGLIEIIARGLCVEYISG